MKSFARYVILAPLATALAAPALVPAIAQTVPAGQSCGGLFCDMGLVGHKVAVGSDGQSLPEPTARTASGATVVVEPPDPHRLACHDFFCGAFQHRADLDPVVAPEPVAVATVPEAPVKPTHKGHRKHVAKTDAAAQ